MHKTLKWCLAFGAVSLLAAAMVTGCQRVGETGDGKVKLSFQIWDTAQRNGMESVAKAYMDRNPDVVIDVQVTSWDEYWTKLDAAAESNQLPDIFLHKTFFRNIPEQCKGVGRTHLRGAKGQGYGVPCI